MRRFAPGKGTRWSSPCTAATSCGRPRASPRARDGRARARARRGVVLANSAGVEALAREHGARVDAGGASRRRRARAVGRGSAAAGGEPRPPRGAQAPRRRDARGRGAPGRALPGDRGRAGARVARAPRGGAGDLRPRRAHRPARAARGAERVCAAPGRWRCPRRRRRSASPTSRRWRPASRRSAAAASPGPEEIAAAGDGIVLVAPRSADGARRRRCASCSAIARAARRSRPRARQTVEREFTWERCGERTLAAYEAALA